MKGMTRREFLVATGLLTLGFLPLNFRGPILRPPGAEKDFLARCIRCGQCIETCPYDSIRAMGITSGAMTHTPYIDPLKTPCYLCQQRGPDGIDRPISEFLRCGEVCPTGAIRKIKNKKDILANVPVEMKIGVSVLDRKICLAWQYDSCGECYYNCPLKDKALRDHPPDVKFPEATGIRPWVD
ncbi:MAG: 4Fe-4S dicluster domain-containing protein, partial [Nitrospirae bacterium]